MLPLIPKGVPLTGGVLPLPLPVMTAVEFFWQIGAFLESPSTDAGGGCPAAVSASIGQHSGLKKHLKRSTLLLLSQWGLKKEVSSLQTFFKF